ncbi:MAG: hypothetical protein ACXWP4_20705 [Polyangiales bacterium]
MKARFGLIFLLLGDLACRGRNEVKKTPEERRLERGPAKFVLLEKGEHAPGFFFDGSFVTSAPATASFDVFDLANATKSTAKSELPGEHPLCAADARGILCLASTTAGSDVFVLDSLTSTPRKLATRIPGVPRDIRSDDADWFVRRAIEPGERNGWGEIVGISRPGGNQRSVASSSELVSSSIDESYVYWLEGVNDPTVFRKKKLGGPTERIASAGELGEIFVRGEFVHHRSAAGTIRRAPKSGGTFADTGVVAPGAFAADEAGFCWCTGTEPRVFCRGADDVSREILLPTPGKCAWLATSKTHLVAQTDDSLWFAPRP